MVEAGKLRMTGKVFLNLFSRLRFKDNIEIIVFCVIERIMECRRFK